MVSNLVFHPALQHPDLAAPSAFKAMPAGAEVAEIDPAYAGGDEFCKYYAVPITEGANCVIVEATRAGVSTIAACVALVNYKIDFNGAVRKTLNARRVSLAPLDMVLKQTGMEFGSITPIGLPSEWVVLLDHRVMEAPHIIIGSGLLRSKLKVPTASLKDLPCARVIVSEFASLA